MIDNIIKFLFQNPKSTVEEISAGINAKKEDYQDEFNTLIKQNYIAHRSKIKKKKRGEGSISFHIYWLAPKGQEYYNNNIKFSKNAILTIRDNEDRKRIFISHAYLDKNIADRLIEKILSPIFNFDKQKDIFYTSKRATGVQSRLNWRNKIRSSIIDCDIFIALITDNFKRSEMCLNELGAAWVLEKRIFPLILPPVQYKNFSVIISELQADNILNREDVESFIGMISKDLYELYNIEKRQDIDIEEYISKFLKSLRSYLRKNPDIFNNKINQDVEKKNEQTKRHSVLKLKKPKTFNVRPGFNRTGNSDLLNYNEGTFCIWAMITEKQYVSYENTKNEYIVSYATNGGIAIRDTALALYPNAWAILRVAPKGAEKFGKWMFLCNGIHKDRTKLYSSKRLSGWNLFTVSWSQTLNKITFLINNDLIGETEFSNWPTDFSSNIFYGTWPSREDRYYFNSKISEEIFIDRFYDDKLLKDIIKQKPK